MFLYQKLIDRFALRQKFQVPVEFHHMLKAMLGGMPQHVETRNVKVVIDCSIIYKVKPTFDREHLKFCFPNGFVEKVKIDKHLRQKMMLA
ncbi:MAG: hypothetical protein KBT67_06725 [bacterium]|nr:hypothetical protein [Candidatus Limimorpha caballi]